MDYQEDCWIGDSGASSHMVGDDEDHFATTLIQGKVIGKINVEAIPKQGKSSRGVLTVSIAMGVLHKLFSFTTALFHD